MPTSILSGGGQVMLPRRPVTIVLDVTGDAATVDLVFSPDIGAIKSRPGMWIVPDLAGVVSVDAVAVGVASFADPTSLHLTITADRGARDPHSVTVAPTAASGLSRVGLITITADSEALIVRTNKPEQEDPLPELASAARVATRRILGVRWCDPALAATTVVIDGSASMSRHWADGTVSALVEVCVGVSAVTAPSAPVDAVVHGRTRRVLSGPTTTLLEQVSGAFNSEYYRTGFPVDSELAAAVGGPPVRHHIITDSVPASWLVKKASPESRPGGSFALLLIDSRKISTSAQRALVGQTWAQILPSGRDATVRDRLYSSAPELTAVARALASIG